MAYATIETLASAQNIKMDHHVTKSEWVKNKLGNALWALYEPGFLNSDYFFETMRMGRRGVCDGDMHLFTVSGENGTPVAFNLFRIHGEEVYIEYEASKKPGLGTILKSAVLAFASDHGATRARLELAYGYSNTKGYNCNKKLGFDFEKYVSDDPLPAPSTAPIYMILNPLPSPDELCTIVTKHISKGVVAYQVPALLKQIQDHSPTWSPKQREDVRILLDRAVIPPPQSSQTSAFITDLKSHHTSIGSKSLDNYPKKAAAKIAKCPVPLQELYDIVHARGGYDTVNTTHGAWRKVYRSLSIYNSTFVNGGARCKQHYQKFLLSYDILKNGTIGKKRALPTGISFCKTKGKYIVRKYVNGKSIFIGLFYTTHEAIRALDDFRDIGDSRKKKRTRRTMYV